MVRNSAVIQAAGRGSRFLSEEYKLLVPIDGMPLILRTLEPVTVAGFDEIIVVIGAHANQMRSVLLDYPVKIIENKEWEKGQSTSLTAGLRAVSETSERACLMLGDQPFIRSETLNTLLSVSEAYPDEVIVPVFNGQRGNPIVVPAGRYQMLLALTEGDMGGKKLLEQAGYRSVPVSDAGVLRDIDTIQDMPGIV